MIVIGNTTNAVVEDQWHDAGVVQFIAGGDASLIQSVVLASLEMSGEQERMRVQMQDFKRGLGNLSVKQMSVLDALVRGGSNKQIAGEFGVSENDGRNRLGLECHTLSCDDFRCHYTFV